jgi:hypothetical protein
MSKQKTCILSNGKINSKKMIIPTSAILLDDFLANPIVLKDHIRGTFNVLGRWQNIRIEAEQLLAEPEFDLGCADGKELARKVAAGFVKGISIMGEILEAHIELIDGAEIVVVTKFLLKEVSFVDIPSNKTCLVLCDKDMNVLTDWTFSDLTVLEVEPQTKKTKKMDFKKIAIELGLSDDASEDEILSALKNQGTVVANFADQQKKQKEKQGLEIVQLFEQAVADNKIGADKREHFIKLGDLDFDTAKGILESLPKPQSLSSIARSGASTGMSAGNKTFEDHFRAGTLVTLADSEKDRLYKEWFGISMKDDTFAIKQEGSNK